MKALPPRLLGAYRRADYLVARLPAIRIGRCCDDAALDLLGAREGIILTAANPASRRHASAWNARMNERLAEHLRGLHHLAAEGRGRGWREPGFLVAAPLARACRIGREFGQNAVVQLRRGQAPRVVVL